MGTKKRLKKLKARAKLLAEIGLQAATISKEAESTAQSALALVDKLTRRVRVLEMDTAPYQGGGARPLLCSECGGPMAEGTLGFQPCWRCATFPTTHPLRRRESPPPEASFKSCGPEEP